MLINTELSQDFQMFFNFYSKLICFLYKLPFYYKKYITYNYIKQKQQLNRKTKYKNPLFIFYI